MFPGRINRVCPLAIVFNSSETADCHLGDHEIHERHRTVISPKMLRMFQSSGHLLGGGCHPLSEPKRSGRLGLAGLTLVGYRQILPALQLGNRKGEKSSETTLWRGSQTQRLPFTESSPSLGSGRGGG